MRKFVLVALSFTLLLANGCDDHQRIARLEKDNAELKAQLEKQNVAASLGAQEKCSSAAKTFFNEGWGGRSDALTLLLTFQNHFNRKQNRCFILVEWHYQYPKTHTWTNHMSVFDVFENNEYATFAETHYLDTPPGVNIPDSVITCRVTGTECKSIDEFNNLVRPFMND